MGTPVNLTLIEDGAVEIREKLEAAALEQYIREIRESGSVPP